MSELRTIEYVMNRLKRTVPIHGINTFQAYECEAIFNEINTLQSSLTVAQEENKRYRLALEFYADEKNYDDEHAPVVPFRNFTNYDEGEKARNALNGGK
jgi:cell shape-determining protein MreC